MVRELEEADAAREAAKLETSLVQRTYRSLGEMRRDVADGFAKIKRDIADALKAVNAIAKGLSTRLEEAEDQIEDLKIRLALSEQRVDDLKRTVDAARGSTTPPSAEVVDLKPPRRA